MTDLTQPDHAIPGDNHQAGLGESTPPIVHVFDTWAAVRDGRQLHFDVLTVTLDADKARAFALDWLASIGLPASQVQVSQCLYCHSEALAPEALSHLRRADYLIHQLEGCPAPDLPPKP